MPIFSILKPLFAVLFFISLIVGLVGYKTGAFDNYLYEHSYSVDRSDTLVKNTSDTSLNLMYKNVTSYQIDQIKANEHLRQLEQDKRRKDDVMKEKQKYNHLKEIKSKQSIPTTLSNRQRMFMLSSKSAPVIERDSFLLMASSKTMLIFKESIFMNSVDKQLGLRSDAQLLFRSDSTNRAERPLINDSLSSDH